MTDEATPTPADESVETPAASNADVRQSELFRRATAELKSKRAQLSELREQLDSRRAADEKAAGEAERRALEAKGEYETILKQREAELAAVQAKHTRDMLEMNLSLALSRAGASNAHFVRGVVAAYDGDADGIAEHVAQIKASDEHAAWFGVDNTLPTGLPSTGTAPPAAKGGQKSLEDRLAEGDHDAQNEVMAQYFGLDKRG
jgi:hypothetical protein